MLGADGTRDVPPWRNARKAQSDLGEVGINMKRGIIFESTHVDKWPL